MTTAFILTAETIISDLAQDLGQNRGALMDLRAEAAWGEYHVELTQDGGDNDRIDVMYFPAIQRAAIDTNGSTNWTDATSVEDAIRRYRDDEMAN